MKYDIIIDINLFPTISQDILMQIFGVIQSDGLQKHVWWREIGAMCRKFRHSKVIAPMLFPMTILVLLLGMRLLFCLQVVNPLP